MTATSLALLASGAALFGACEGASAERQVLTAFFQAVRVRDPILLSRVSTLPLTTLTFGPVRNFTITEVSGAAGNREVTVESDGETFLMTLEKRDGGWLVTRLRASRTSP